MTADVKNRGIPPSFFAEFYQTPCGIFTAEQITGQITALWPDLKGLHVLVVGWPYPYLAPLLETAERVVAATPHGTSDDADLLHRQKTATALVEPDVLPFYERSFDRILIIHGSEYAENLMRFFEHAENLLRNDGRIISVLPNRNGFWHSGTDMPFTGGHAVSEKRHIMLLENAGFSVEYRNRALFMPPVRNTPLLKLAALYEKAGNILFPSLCGVHLCEARKDILSGAAVQPVKRLALTKDAKLKTSME